MEDKESKMKKLLLIPLLLFCFTAFGQFTKPQLYTNINTNIRLKTYSPTRMASLLDSLVATMGSGSGMVYPGVGIPLSTGSAWGTSITDNSANWNTAFGWGNHATAGYLSDTTAFIKTQGTSILTDDIIVDLDTMDIMFSSDDAFAFSYNHQPDGIHDWSLGFNGQLYSYPQSGPGTEMLQIVSYNMGIFDAGGANFAIDLRSSMSTWINRIPIGFNYAIIGSGNENILSVDNFLGNIDIGNASTTLTLPNIPAASGQTYAVVVDDTGLVSSQAISGGSGDVTKVGTPVNNQIGVWTGDGTIEGTAGLTYDGSNFQLTGDIGSTGSRITNGWFTDLQVTNAIAGSITGNAATVTTNANLTGHVTSTGNATTLGSFTKAQLDGAVSDGNVLYVGDVTQYTDELAQDAVGAMVDGSLTYVDGTPLLQRAALTGAVTASAGSNATSLGSFTVSQLSTALSDANISGDNSGDQALANTSDATSHTVTLTGGTSVQLIEGSNITLTTGGTGGVGTVTIASTGGGSSAFDDLTAAAATNSIDNTNYLQTWNWSTLASTYGLSLLSNSTTASGDAQGLLSVQLTGANSNAGQISVAGRFINNHTGTGSENYALALNASSGDTNYALWVDEGNIKLDAGVNFELDATTGTKFGTATTQKIGFYNATPVVRQNAVTTVQELADALTAYGLLPSSTVSGGSGLTYAQVKAMKFK